jgi:hypothetical protein
MRPAAGSKKDALDFLPGTSRQDQEDLIEPQIKGALVYPRSADTNMSRRLRNSSDFRLWQKSTAD